MYQVPEKITQLLHKRLLGGNLRVLSNSDKLIDFCSNDYLGLASNVELSKIIEKEYKQSNILFKNGATGSRLLSGNSPYFDQVEKYLAQVFKTESCLIFNSGYAANVGVLSSIPQKDDTILYDELCHACIKDGIRLSFANRYSFKHNDCEALEKKIKLAQGTIYIVVESIYSMDGDSAPLIEIVNLCEKYCCYLIVDEAHSTGVYGSSGAGLVCELGIENKVFVRIHTFGKAIGSHGGCVVASKDIISFLVNFARTFIYTTAMPLHNLISIKCGFEYISNNPALQLQLSQNITSFNTSIAQTNIICSPTNSAIKVILLSGNEAVKVKANQIKNALFDVKPILSPTVKAGEERLRICLHATNTEKEISDLVILLG